MGAGRSLDVEWRITDELWQRITALLPPEPSHARGGRPRQPARLMMEGALYVLATGSKWKSLPPKFGAASTVYGHVHRWHEAGVFRLMVERGLLPPEWYAEFERRARRVGERRRASFDGPADQDSESHDHRPTPPAPRDRGTDEAGTRVDAPRSQT
jgi:transposase